MPIASPHITVACVIERDGRYLMVEERDKRSGKMVFNQPAGHVEDGESLHQAALRETEEETGWLVALSGLLSVALYTAPATGDTYLRTTFLAEPLRENPRAAIDPDIHAVHWLDYATLRDNSVKMRSPLVLESIERQMRGEVYPLEVILPSSADRIARSTEHTP